VTDTVGGITGPSLVAKLDELTGSVQALSRNAVALQESLDRETQTRKEENARLGAEDNRLERGRRKNRKLAVIALVLVLVVLAGGVALAFTLHRVSCLTVANDVRQTRSSAFNDAMEELVAKLQRAKGRQLDVLTSPPSTSDKERAERLRTYIAAEKANYRSMGDFRAYIAVRQTQSTPSC